jgi:hypothetical protein
MATAGDSEQKDHPDYKQQYVLHGSLLVWFGVCCVYSVEFEIGRRPHQVYSKCQIFSKRCSCGISWSVVLRASGAETL